MAESLEISASNGTGTTADVVIVGGGVAGCAVAYYLSLAGVKATVIEREGIGSQASGFSAGGLNPMEGTHIPGPLAPWQLSPTECIWAFGITSGMKLA